MKAGSNWDGWRSGSLRNQVDTEGDGVLTEWVDEANRLATAHDGCHDMCSAAAIIRGYANLHVYGDSVPWDRLQDLLFRMRVCNRTGHFPKAHRGAA